jgi:hypothetical protein
MDVQLRSLTQLYNMDFENRVFLGYYAASSDNSLTTFRDNLHLQGSRIQKQKPETLERGSFKEECGGDKPQ